MRMLAPVRTFGTSNGWSKDTGTGRTPPGLPSTISSPCMPGWNRQKKAYLPAASPLAAVIVEVVPGRATVSNNGRPLPLWATAVTVWAMPS